MKYDDVFSQENPHQSQPEEMNVFFLCFYFFYFENTIAVSFALFGLRTTCSNLVAIVSFNCMVLWIILYLHKYIDIFWCRFRQSCYFFKNLTWSTKCSTYQNSIKIVTRPFTSGPAMKKKEIDHPVEECRRVEPNDKPDVSK